MLYLLYDEGITVLKEPKVQISKSLYNDIIRYFMNGQQDLATARRIREGIDRDIEARVRREYYTAYKCAPTAEEREKARQAYIDSVGIQENFRY